MLIAAWMRLPIGQAPIATSDVSQTASAAATTSALAATTTNALRSEPLYPVVRVVDGDTVIVNMRGTSTTLRLIGLDTPEVVDPRKTVQCFGVEASNHAKEMLTGQRVRLEFDASQGALDKYGRTLAYVFLDDGRNFNESMIADGYGHEYTYGLPYKYQTEFKDAEKKARERKRGLWADDACAAESARS